MHLTVFNPLHPACVSFDRNIFLIHSKRLIHCPEEQAVLHLTPLPMHDVWMLFGETFVLCVVIKVYCSNLSLTWL